MVQAEGTLLNAGRRRKEECSLKTIGFLGNKTQGLSASAQSASPTTQSPVGLCERLERNDQGSRLAPGLLECSVRRKIGKKSTRSDPVWLREHV